MIKLKTRFIFITLLILVNNRVTGQGIICNPNTFWVKSGSGSVMEYTITGSNVTYINNSPSIPGSSLAFCNNLDGGLFSPTFYAGGSGIPTDLYFYNGSIWVTVPYTHTCFNKNSGGYGNFLYIQDNSIFVPCIQRYTNNAFIDVFHDSILQFTVADIAIDEIGNVWTFMGQLPNTQFIYVVDSLGQVIKQYPFNLNTNNAYGCFMLNSILYVGLGNSNPTNPNTLIPISFSNNTAIQGTTIPFYTNAGIDLASCDPGLPLILDETYSHELGLLVYPTITAETLNVNWNAKADPGSIYELKIFDISGRIVHEQSQKVYTDENRTIIDVKTFSSGIYTMQLTSGKYHSFRKFIKN